MKTSYYMLLPFMFFILACSENGEDTNNDETYCEFDLPGTYKFRNIFYEEGYCGEVNYQIPDDVFSGYFTFGNSIYKTEFEFKCDNWWVHPDTGDSVNVGFYDCQIDSGTYSYTKELTDHSRDGVWEFDIDFTSSNGNTWSSISHYYCSQQNEGRPELLLFDYRAPDNKIYELVIFPK